MSDQLAVGSSPRMRRVAAGSVVAEDALIGAGAVVVRDVPAGATVFGNPARVIS